MGSIPPLSLGPQVVRPFKTTVVRPGGNFTRMFLAHAVPATRSIPASTKSETRFIDCPFRSELTNSKTDTLWQLSMSSQRLSITMEPIKPSPTRGDYLPLPLETATHKDANTGHRSRAIRREFPAPQFGLRRRRRSHQRGARWLIDAQSRLTSCPPSNFPVRRTQVSQIQRRDRRMGHQEPE